MISDSFVTGSRVYGVPREDSDWDIVIRCDKKDATEIFGIPQVHIGPTGIDYPLDNKGTSHYLGNINYILCFTDQRFDNWKKGTETLKNLRPVTRDVAVNLFKSLFEKELK